MERVPIYTIGYGNRKIEDLLSILSSYEIDYLIDIRSQPYSRFNPDFSMAALESHLKRCGIKYVNMGESLGGRPSDESCYTEGKVDYLKCREKPFFLEGISRLRTAWEKQLRVVLLCSEANPEECHRSKLVGETLENEKIKVAHIDAKGILKTQEQVIHCLTAGQSALFGVHTELYTSRKRYHSTQGRDNEP